MRRGPYTVIVRFKYNHVNIRKVIDTWKNQTIPPAEILFIDNGSDNPLELNEPLCRVINIDKSNSLAASTNIGVMNTNTNYFILANGDTLVNKRYASFQYILSDEDTQVFAFCRLDMPSIIDIAPEGKKGEPQVAEGVYKYTQPTMAVVIKGLNLPIPHDGAMYSKSNWLWCNEALIGYGFQDCDYFIRWQLLGKRTVMTNECILYHLHHEIKYVDDNRETHIELIENYKKNGIPILTEDNRCWS